jgi:hypothetical protein
MKIWILRTEAYIPDDVYESVERHPENRIFYTKLYVLYDKPTNITIKDVRIMCEIPNYMFPEIKEEECCEFESFKIFGL